MALRIRFARPASGHSLRSRILMIALAGCTAVLAVGLCVFWILYIKYTGVVNDRLKQPIFENTAKIFAAPREVRPGQKLSVRLIANELREAGYTQDGAPQTSQLGTFSQGAQQITVRPGPQSYHAPDAATIHVSGGVVDAITDDHGPLSSYELEPLLITGLSDANRTKRRVLTYDEIPPNLVHAVIAIEDRRFFEHGGLDYWRILGAMRNDIFHLHHFKEGASTLTQQLARGFFLSPERTYSRKIREAVISIILEHRFNKQQILAMYANEINLGQLGSFSVDGFGEAAQDYFGKDVRQLDLAQCALLAGLIQSPSRLNPYRHAERAIERRNLVLDSMVETGAITKDQAETAKMEPLHLAAANVDASEAPYFVDLVHDQLTQHLGDRDFNREGLHIYTSLDPDLQRLATQTVDATIPQIDAQVDRLHARDRRLGRPYIYPQVALIALNPHTGQVLALVGGRNYGNSQVNHAVAHRPTGSIFKPFVYAAAFQTAVEGTMLPGQTKLFSPVTILSDMQQTYGAGTPYEYTPRNYKGEFYGDITARFALMRSDNNATIGLASMVGFDRVAALARNAGIKSAQGTPSMAIGSYDATPLDMAGAYTIYLERRHSHRSMDAGQRAHFDRRHYSGFLAHDEPSARSARRLPHHLHDGGRSARQRARRLHNRREGILRNRRRGPQHGIHLAGRRQNRHQPRCVVRRIHEQSALHRVGRQRRLHRRATRRCARRCAHLGKLHEAGRSAAAILRHQRVHAAARNPDRNPRQRHQPAGRWSLPRRLHRSLSRRHRAHRHL